MYIAVEGCSHGELDKIYETIQFIEENQKVKVELLLCCGDFQSVRDEADLVSMACPDKYKSMQDFWKYYQGIKKAPVLTIFIGGNHEASNYLQELPFGGWVAPNIYYLGYAGIVNFKGIRIGGLSGIYKRYNYNKSHYECPPYDRSTQRSVYHIRNEDVSRLMEVVNDIDIMMSHDWPNGIVQHGDKEKLIRKKQHFRSDIENHALGSDPAWELLVKLKPKYWFSGHLHVKFAAVVEHREESNETKKITKFLALDKCLPRRNFLQVLEVSVGENTPDGLYYDREWLTILKNSKDMTNTESEKSILSDDLRIPDNFSLNDSCMYNPDTQNKRKPVVQQQNAQTVDFCEWLGIIDPSTLVTSNPNRNEHSILESSTFQSFSDYSCNTTEVLATSINEEEINIDSDDDSPRAEELYKTSDSLDTDNDKPHLNISHVLPPVQNKTSTPNKCGSQGSSDGLSSIQFDSPGISSESSESKSDNDALVPRSLSSMIALARESYLKSKEDRSKICENVLQADAGSVVNTTNSESEMEVTEKNHSTETRVKKAFKRRNQKFYSSQSEDD